MKNIFLLALIIFSGYLCQAQAPIPGKIEGELWSSMSGVVNEVSTDAGGGLDVGYIDKGDWMKYSIICDSAGSYTVSFRIASILPGAQFQVLNAAGIILATLNVPNTGGYQTWQTITAVISFPAGAQTIELLSTVAVNWNLNWMSFATKSVTPPVQPPPVTGNFYVPLDSAFAGLDSVVIHNPSTTSLVTFNIDTLTTTGAQTFLLSVGGFNPTTGDDVSAVRLIRIKSFNGITSVVWSVDPKAWAGQGTTSATSWSTPIINNKVVVQVTTTANPINWTHKRYSL
jgi:hypothetical protein